MFQSDGDSIRVDVPVGLLLHEAQEIDLSVIRVDAAPLSVKLRLIPAGSGKMPKPGPHLQAVEEVAAVPTYTGRTDRQPNGEGLAHEEYGCGD